MKEEMNEETEERKKEERKMTKKRRRREEQKFDALHQTEEKNRERKEQTRAEKQKRKERRGRGGGARGKEGSTEKVEEAMMTKGTVRERNGEHERGHRHRKKRLKKRKCIINLLQYHDNEEMACSMHDRKTNGKPEERQLLLSSATKEKQRGIKAAKENSQHKEIKTKRNENGNHT